MHILKRMKSALFIGKNIESNSIHILVEGSLSVDKLYRHLPVAILPPLLYNAIWSFLVAKKNYVLCYLLLKTTILAEDVCCILHVISGQICYRAKR